MNTIEFYIPSDQKIPTKLRLKIDGKYDVYYQEAKLGIDRPYGFGWDFDFYGVSIDEYEPLLDAIVDKMVWQSYDHGVQWRETHREVLHEPEGEWDKITVRVYFRRRDAG